MSWARVPEGPPRSKHGKRLGTETAKRHELSDSQTLVLTLSLRVLVLLEHGPPGTGTTETIAAVLGPWLPCVPLGWLVG
eukprot:5410557-Pyramimonas_sp.AAC.1